MSGTKYEGNRKMSSTVNQTRLHITPRPEEALSFTRMQSRKAVP